MTSPRSSALARPTVGVVTNVGLAHAELLGNAEGVAREKGDLLAALPADGLAVLDAGDAASAELAARSAARVVLVSVEGRPVVAGAPDVHAAGSDSTRSCGRPSRCESPWGSGTVDLNVRGAHQVVNAVLAATVALALDVPFDRAVAGLAMAEPTSGRMDFVRSGTGLLVLDDAYNASPASMAAAIDALVAMPVTGKRIAVLGEMRELGDDGPEAHAAVGQLVADAPVDLVVVVGREAAPLAAAARAGDSDEVVEVADAAGALDVLRGRIGDDDVVLVKGSRAVGLDVVVRELTHAEATS